MDDELIIDVDIPMPPNFQENESGYSQPPSVPFSSGPFQQPYQPTQYQPPSAPFQQYQPPSVPFPQTYHPPSSLNMPPSFQSIEMPELYTPKSNMSYQSQSEIQYESSYKRHSPVYESPRETQVTQVTQVTQFEGTETPEEPEEPEDEAWYSVITKTVSDHSVTIHSIADLIFFYMFFKYTRNKYAETQIKIDDTREQIKKIQRQYGLNTKRITK